MNDSRNSVNALAVNDIRVKVREMNFDGDKFSTSTATVWYMEVLGLLIGRFYFNAFFFLLILTGRYFSIDI